jgi:hypothetical protein
MIDSRLIDVQWLEHDGYPPELAAEDTHDNLCSAARDAGAVVTTFPEHLWIEQKDWPDAAADNDKYHTWPLDFLDRFTNQGSGNGGYSTHECTTHCLRAVAEAARNRIRQIAVGPPVPKQRLPISASSASVWFSCLSIYAEANPREWGGASTRQVLGIAASRGFLPDLTQPEDWGFKHQIQGTCGAGGINQSRGSWLPLSKFPDGWQETARHFRPLEYIFPETWEQIVCLVLNGYAVGVGRSGHSIPYMKWVVSDKVMQYVDSYDVFRYDSVSMIKSAVGGAYSIVTMTTPDDWEKPVG